jgi:competence protein ComEA
MLLIAALAALATAADEKEVQALPDGAGKDLVARVCFDCHGAGNFRKVRKDADEWNDSVGDMVERGAKASPAEIDTLVAYLVKNFGKGSKVRMNSAPLEELKAVLGFSVPEAQAIVVWRDQNGPFKEWRDLLKAPGVDAAKVEAKKDEMEF